MRLQTTAAGLGPARTSAGAQPARRNWLKRLGALLGGGLLASRGVQASPLQTQGQEDYLGEIMLFAGNFVPQGYAACNGQVLPIAQYTALFSLLGTTYGGNGTSTFALPDLRSRIPVGYGQGTGLSAYQLGQVGGQESVTLTTNQLPAHTHQLQGIAAPGTSADPTNNLLANDGRGGPQYIDTGATTALSSQSISAAGGNQAHENRSPYLALNYCICINGVYPSRQ